MLLNNNLKICRTLVKRDFRFHKVKNLVMILAVALTAGLYTFVFLLGNAVENSFLLSYEYSYGSVSHILYSGLTEHQADMLAQNAKVKSSVRLNTVGRLSDPVIGRRSVKLAVTDRAYAETVLSVPSSGRLPEKPGEIALDEFTMGSLGIVHETGASVAIQWTDPEGRIHKDTFTLCGWWNSPTNFSEACAWITAETASALSPGYNGENAENVTLGVTLYQPEDLEEQAAKILKEQGVPDTAYTTNLAYQDAQTESASSQARPFYTPAILVLLCGFLMIYAIIHVSAEQERDFFAGLKAQGMTPRQFRYCLLIKGLAAAALGTPPGFLAGFGLNLLLTGRVVIGMEEDPALYFLNWRPFAAAGICTFATVLLACFLPAFRLAGKTPAEIFRENIPGPKRKRKEKDGRMTLPALALRTLGRNRSRTVLAVGTMLLAVLLLSSVWVEYISMKEDVYLSAMSPWDYSIADGSAYTSWQRYNQNSRAITEETVSRFLRRPEVQSVSGLKSREITLTASRELRQRIVDYYDQPYDETQTLRDTQAQYTEWMKGLDRLEETGEYTALVIGMDGEYLDYMLENMPFTSGSFDKEKFASGDYVIAGGAYHEGVSSLAAGETAELEEQSFQVLGSVMYDDSYLCGANSKEADFSLIYFLPLESFDLLFPDQGFRQLAVDIDHEKQRSFETFLDEYEQESSRGVGITRRSEYQENFENTRLNMVLVQLIVGMVLMAIALLNFLNLMVAKIFSRRKEFAVYQSLGMTKAQLRSLAVLEGFLLAVLMAAVLIPVTVLFVCLVLPGYVAEQSWVSVYTFSLAPLWISVPVILFFSVGTPFVCLDFVVRGTIHERMRKEW